MMSTSDGLHGLLDLVRLFTFVFCNMELMSIYLPVWGTANPCCAGDTGSLEPGNTNDLGGPKYVSAYKPLFIFTRN